MQAEITIVYVNHYSLEELKRSLQSVSDFTAILFKVIVINNSPSQDLSALTELTKDILIIETGTNLGFGKACNKAIQAANTPYVLLLNPDTYLYEDSIALSLQAYKELDPEATGILSCGHKNEDGSFQYSCLERADLPLFPFVKIPWKRLKKEPKEYHNESERMVAKHVQSHYVFAVHGSFMIGSRAMLLNESFDEDFFLYAEEIDLCRRLSNKGKRSYHFSETAIVHTAENARQSEAIRHQMYLSSGLLVLKIYGSAGYAVYYLVRLIRFTLLLLALPFLPKKIKTNLSQYLKDVKPYSSDYLRVFCYSRQIDSHLPLKSSHLA